MVETRYNLRRIPARRDRELYTVHDALGGCEDVLRIIALMATVMPQHGYSLRSGRRGPVRGRWRP